MKLRFSAILVLTLLFAACNNIQKPLNSILNLEELPTVTHQIDQKKDTLIELASGLRFIIPAGSIKTDNGGEAELQIRVAMDFEDMLKAGLTTMSDGKAMSSAGMFEFEVTNGEIVKPIQVEMPTDRIDEDMQLFKGKRDANGQMNWEDPQDLVQKAASGKDLFNQACANCHNIAAEQTLESKIPLSYPYQQYDKAWLLDYVRGMGDDAASRCACQRWNSQTENEDESFIDLPFETNDSDFIGQYTPEGDSTEQVEEGFLCTHSKSLEEEYNDAELTAIYDYIEAKSKELGLTLPTYNAAACAAACKNLGKQYKTAYKQEQALWEASVAEEKSKADTEKALKNYEMVKVKYNSTSSSGGIDFNVIVENVEQAELYQRVTPKKLIASHYKFEIQAEGWYNVDMILKKGKYDECQLDITLSGKHQDRVEVFLVIPSIQIFAQAAKIGNVYRISQSGMLSIPMGEVAWVYAIGEENGKVFLAQQGFEIKASQSIKATVKKSSKAKQKKALKTMAADLDLKVDKMSKADRKEVKKLQKQLAENTASLEKIKEDLASVRKLLADIEAKMDKPSSCACACEYPSLEDEPDGKALFLANCASCHSVDMKRDLTGPALADTEEHWAAFPREELYAYIRNSQGLMAGNSAQSQAYANELYQKWGSVMTLFPNFSDREIEAILGFIRAQKD